MSNEFVSELKAACKPSKLVMMSDGYNSLFMLSQNEVFENVKRVLIDFDAVDSNDLYGEDDDDED